MPRVSVIVSAYNTEKFIRETLDSVLGQTYKDYELILINDGSTDSTGDIIEDYAKFNNVRTFHQENQGIPYSFSRGVKLAEGEFVIICGADDVMEPQLLEKEVNFYDSANDPLIGLVYTDGILIDQNGNCLRGNLLSFDNITGDNPAEHMVFIQDYPMSSFLTRREVYDKVGYYDLRYSTISDTDFIIRASEYYRFGVIPEKLVRYRKHTTNITKMGNVKMLRNLALVLDRNRSILLSKGIENSVIDKAISIAEEGLQKAPEQGMAEGHAETVARLYMYNKFYRLQKKNLFSSKRFCLFGAGMAGHVAREAAEYFGFEIDAIYDNDPNKAGTLISEIPVINAAELSGRKPPYPILVVSIYSQEIGEQLDRLGYKENEDYLKFF